MQISYLYASDFPARQTSRNNNKRSKTDFGYDQALLWLFWEVHKLTGDARVKGCIIFICKSEENQTIARVHVQLARGDLKHEIWSPVFNMKMLTFSHCLRTKNAPKEVANSYRREPRGISKFYWSKRNLFVLAEPSLLHHTFSLGPGARFSKAPETFRARKAIGKSRTLRLQSCFIDVFLIWTETPFIQEVSGL